MKIVTPAHHLLSSPFLLHRHFRSVQARKWQRSDENCEWSNWLWINNKYGFILWTHLSFHLILDAAPPYFQMGMLMKIHPTGVFAVCRRGSDWGVTKIVSDVIDCQNADWLLWSHLFYHPISAAAPGSSYFRTGMSIVLFSRGVFVVCEQRGHRGATAIVSAVIVLQKKYWHCRDFTDSLLTYFRRGSSPPYLYFGHVTDDLFQGRFCGVQAKGS